MKQEIFVKDSIGKKYLHSNKELTNEIGYVYQEISGHYVFVTNSNGCFESHTLRLIANKLDELNKDLNDRIDKDFDESKEEENDFNIGDKVKFIAATDEQINWGSNDDPREVLNTKDVYTIKNIEIHSWHTKLYLFEITGKFNSAHFKKVK